MLRLPAAANLEQSACVLVLRPEFHDLRSRWLRPFIRRGGAPASVGTSGFMVRPGGPNEASRETVGVPAQGNRGIAPEKEKQDLSQPSHLAAVTP